ncbi:Uncharacterised protein [Mycobacteroides abscessus subsp. abscessus]|nr:Uncharacterised protein [Mycobacteroides abscessus subsp. abscessus]
MQRGQHGARHTRRLLTHQTVPAKISSSVIAAISR